MFAITTLQQQCKELKDKIPNFPGYEPDEQTKKAMQYCNNLNPVGWYIALVILLVPSVMNILGCVWGHQLADKMVTVNPVTLQHGAPVTIVQGVPVASPATP